MKRSKNRHEKIMNREKDLNSITKSTPLKPRTVNIECKGVFKIFKNNTSKNEESTIPSSRLGYLIMTLLSTRIYNSLEKE